MLKPQLTTADFERAAKSLGCTSAAVEVVCKIEAPTGGFDRTGQPRILFEGHIFSRLTKGKWDRSNPTISYPRWTRTNYATGPTPEARNAGEHKRLQQAVAMDRTAALMAASWGRFQILGENYRSAGHPTLQSFINAMYASEAEHLDAFIDFVRSEGLAVHLANLNWEAFAAGYNGPEHAKNQYAPRMAAAYLERTQA